MRQNIKYYTALKPNCKLSSHRHFIIFQNKFFLLAFDHQNFALRRRALYFSFSLFWWVTIWKVDLPGDELQELSNFYFPIHGLHTTTMTYDCVYWLVKLVFVHTKLHYLVLFTHLCLEHQIFSSQKIDRYDFSRCLRLVTKVPSFPSDDKWSFYNEYRCLFTRDAVRVHSEIFGIVGDSQSMRKLRLSKRKFQLENVRLYC